MKCPFCGHPESRVVDSRPTDDMERIRRRRECISCAARFTTFEMIEHIPLIVIKKDKTREMFDREKLLGGLRRACEKRPVPVAVLERVVNEIEAELQNSMEREIPTARIGELAMNALKGIDEIAYVRFASVYREFKDVSTLMDELLKLLQEKQ
ncbi:MAG: transcriptional regulator NrdR [Oscillospiraceae bacterium]|jgi:transcriptional repressor NrdR|nr:transcriptional regulator NrdR [Oscillospiraceae bacterium]